MMNEKEKKILEVGNKIGQREMLLNIQRQALSNGGIVDLKTLEALSKICEGEEMILGVENYEGEIQRDMRLQSIAIANGKIKISEPSLVPENLEDVPEQINTSIKEITINFDGGSRGNPGPSGCGCVIKFGDKVLRKNKFIGHGTNNEAEYTGIIIAIEKLKELDISGVTVHFIGDSQLILKQLSKEWKIKEPRMRALAEEVWKQLDGLKLKATFTQVPREQNKDADKLTNMAMDGKLVDDSL